MKTLNTLAAVLLLSSSLLIAYDEGGSSPYTTKFGFGAGTNNNTNGYYNVFSGYKSGHSNTAGDKNVFSGYMSGYTNTTGSNNVFSGYKSGYTNTTGYNNVFSGYQSGYSNTYGTYNVFSGDHSGYANTTGSNNVFSGSYSGISNKTGFANVFSGYQSGYDNTVGDYNVFSGFMSGNHNTTGHQNTFIGTKSGYNADVNNSVFLGCKAGYNATRDNTLYIANSDTNSPLIYGEFDNNVVKINGELNTTKAITAAFTGSTTKEALKMFAISVNNTNTDKKSDVGFSMTNARGDGLSRDSSFTWSFRTWEPDSGFAIAKYGNGGNKELRLYDTDPTDPTTVVLALANGAYCDGTWHNASSRTLKQDIQPLEAKAALKAFRQLKPMTYAYKAQPHDSRVGFIAEDVPELVADPKHKSVSAMDMVALLTKVVQEQEKQAKAKDEKIAAMEAQQKAMKVKISKLEDMQTKVAQMEAILSNLALDASTAKKETLSVNLKQ